MSAAASLGYPIVNCKLAIYTLHKIMHFMTYNKFLTDSRNFVTIEHLSCLPILCSSLLHRISHYISILPTGADVFSSKVVSYFIL